MCARSAGAERQKDDRHEPLLPGRRGSLRPDAAAGTATGIFHSVYHGAAIEDSFHWLRDPGYPQVSDTAILAHLETENAYFNGVMAPLQPLVETLFAELKGRIKEDDASVPVEEHGWLYQWRFETGAQYRKWYRRPAGDGGAEQLLLDEPALAEGKAFFKLDALSVSPDGKLLAYAVDDSGAERFTLRVKNLETGAILPFAITETMGTPVWSDDSRVLLYTVLNAEWRPYQIRAHAAAASRSSRIGCSTRRKTAGIAWRSASRRARR